MLVNTILLGPFGPYTTAVKPTCSRVGTASERLRPTTLGTGTRSGPFDTLTVTVLPLATCDPAAGVVDTTWPAGIESSNTSLRTGLRPASVRCAAVSS